MSSVPASRRAFQSYGPSYNQPLMGEQTLGPALAEHAQAPPRKKMRKGTRSCLECRRRKIRCNVEPGRTAVCRECFVRGSTCVDQEHGHISSTDSATGQAHNLRERVTYLEGLVRQALDQRTAEGDGAPTTSTPTPTDVQRAVEVHESPQKTSVLLARETSLHLPSGLEEDAPALSLFDNAVITRRNELPQLCQDRQSKHKAVAQTLKALLPGLRELERIVKVSEEWWKTWCQLFPENMDFVCASFAESISQALQSENPSQVGSIVISIALCIEQLPGDWDFSQLQPRGSRETLVERYIASVDQLITSDDEVAGTLGGIACMVMQGKYYINIGRPRKAWLIHQRAISFAKLLGFHRIAAMKPEKPDEQLKRQMSLWTYLFMGERFLAMTLGLPLNIHARFCDPYIPALGELSDYTDSRVVLLRTSSVMAKIVDRNQNSTLDLSTTFGLDEEMEELARSTPQEWWGKLDTQAPTHTDQLNRLLCQFFYHLTRKLLHLPFMLKSGADKRYQYSYTVALDSSREMIRCYDAIRGVEATVPFVCKMVDFEAFCAAVPILLNLYGYSRSTAANTEQDQSDSALVDTTIDILGEASKEAGGIVAVQSLKALKVLASFRTGSCKACDPGSDTAKLSIPYFGTITLGPGKNFRMPREGTYPQPTPKRRPSNGHNSVTTTPADLGLPTPPLASGSTSQCSPGPSLQADAPCSTASAPVSMAPTPYLANSLSFADSSPASASVFQHQHQHHQPVADSTNELFMDYPLISFDSYTAVPPIIDSETDTTPGMGLDRFWGESRGAGNLHPSTDMNMGTTGTDMNVAMGMGAATATGKGADDIHVAGGPAGGGVGGAKFPPWLGIGHDLDSSWDWTGMDTIQGSLFP